jgi:hypothetical protein
VLVLGQVLMRVLVLLESSVQREAQECFPLERGSLPPRAAQAETQTLPGAIPQYWNASSQLRVHRSQLVLVLVLVRVLALALVAA